MTARSWETNSTASPRWSRRSLSSSMISAWMVTSRAVVASSAMMQPRLAGDRDGDHDPLQHAARQLGRDLVEDQLRVAQADRREQLERLGVRRAAGQLLLDPQHLGQLAADGQRRVQVRGRVLEHRADAGAVQPLPAAPGQLRSRPAARTRSCRARCRSPSAARPGRPGRSASCRCPTPPPGRRSRPCATRQRDAADRGGGPVVHGDVQVLDAENLVRRRIAGHRRPPEPRGWNGS